ncbi:hypothetical protein [Azospirillum griseum]|uniref:Uncharacterized protein n=1 Tax=Azospirillum griseum TaxID=2496639 RepID=A0A3S0HW54_9PROT|nr:hypothetical protein [Azospirillum griseum]RTR11627.1 hypothetical protein EJ903_25985 [Azospirillum griseum]
MTRIRLRIGETWSETDARLLAIMDQVEAGEVVPKCGEYDLGFETWEHFAAELGQDAPELAADMLTMPEADRLDLFDAPAGQEALQRLWTRLEADTACSG